MLVAIETATDVGSVAVGTGRELAGEVVIGLRSRHAESLLPALDFLLTAVGLRRADLQGVVVGAGPGSFTGVRVAAATARGLARGLEVPLYAYSSLAALALDVTDADLVCPLFDARRGQVYAACYQREAAGGALTPVLEPAALDVAELLQRLGGRSPVFIGDGAIHYAGLLGIEPPFLRLPRAAALLRLAAADPAAGLVHDMAGWEPSYLRASGAERGVAG
jgi:tRNA threonylcarbamoyladenosine biosynthesis protein TsaB